MKITGRDPQRTDTDRLAESREELARTRALLAGKDEIIRRLTVELTAAHMAMATRAADELAQVVARLPASLG